MTDDQALDICPLCGRSLGQKREKHHLVPRLKGGRDTVTLHPICHRKIHSLFTEAELARTLNTVASLRQHPDIAGFIKWLDGKPADFYRRTEASGKRRRR